MRQVIIYLNTCLIILFIYITLKDLFFDFHLCLQITFVHVISLT